jgi:hypothetical protein
MADTWAALRQSRLNSAGVPISWAAQAVVEHILDHGPASFGELTILLSQVMQLKEDRILKPPPWSSWADFTVDVLDQITTGKGYGNADILQVIGHTPTELMYDVRSDFQDGEKYNIFPQAQSLFIVPCSKSRRLKADKDAQYLMTVRSVVNEVDRLRKIAEETSDPVLSNDLEQIVRWTSSRFGKVVRHLSGLPDKSPRERKPRKTAQERPDRPTAKDLARSKYGLDGHPASRKARVFGVDGKRECPGCGKRRLPEDYEVYTDGKNTSWFLRGKCMTCFNTAKNH